MESSKLYKKSERNKKISKIIQTITLLILVILLILDFIFVLNSSFYIEYSIDKLAVTQVVFGALIILIANIIPKFIDKNYIKKYALSKYNNPEFNNRLKTEMVSGDTKTEGSIRNKYIYSMYIPKYNCTLKRYYEQELLGTYRSIGTGNDRRIVYRFRFITINNVLEYSFQLDDKYWRSLYKLREKIDNIELADNKVIIRRNIQNKKNVSILEEINFIDDIEKLYFKIITSIDEVSDIC